MDKHHYKIIIFTICVLVAVASTIFVLSKKQSESSSYTPPVAEAQESQLTSVGSPDGKLTLTMKDDKGNDNIKYMFLVTDSSDGIQKEVFTKTVPLASNISIPYNTFSPDDKYIFLKEEDSGQTDYFVLTSSGMSITQDATTLDISSLFAAKYSDYKITDITGWGGVTLIVINTNKNNGSLGPSFWFDIPSKSIIQLSTRFN